MIVHRDSEWIRNTADALHYKDSVSGENKRGPCDDLKAGETHQVALVDKNAEGQPHNPKAQNDEESKKTCENNNPSPRTRQPAFVSNQKGKDDEKSDRECLEKLGVTGIKHGTSFVG